MDKIIKNILKKIESEGYEAYIVGGFVRDFLLGSSSYDVDICTNALPRELKVIFNLTQDSNGYGGFNLKIKKYNIDITTYRKENKYDKRKPVELEYVSNLIEDIKRRDFTVNAFCMDRNENIVDLLGSRHDLNKKIIRTIGSPNKKFKDDPLRMLRAVRFASILNFEIEKETYKAIQENAKYAESLSSDRIKYELDKILGNDNYVRGLHMLNTTGLSKYLGLSFDTITPTSDILGMWAQINCKKITFTNTIKDNIIKINQIIKLGKITNFELFNYGLYLCTVAGEILGIDKETINKKFHKLPIKSMKDIDITGKEIMNILNIEPSKQISEIINNVKVQILSDKLKNHKNEIKKYIVGKWKNEKE